MNYKILYAKNNTIRAPKLCDVSLDGDIGVKFDKLIYERVTSDFAIKHILKEAEDCFRDKFDDEYNYGLWRGEFWGKLVLSACRVCRYLDDGDLKNAIRNSVYRLLTFRDENGFLSTYRDSKNIFMPSVEAALNDYGWISNWNIWSRKYTLWAMLECALLLDDTTILDACIKLADHLIGELNELKCRIKDAGCMDGMPACSALKPMLVLYRLTGDKRYLDFALSIADEWDRDDNERPNLIRNALGEKGPHEWYDEKDGWNAKAYEMMSCFDGICELYRVTGNERYLDACKGLYRQLVKYESNIAGSVGYCERFANAREYPNMATEACDAIHWMRLCYELFSLTGEACYMESFEAAYLNAFMAAVNEDGKGSAFFVRSAGRHWNGDAHCQTKYQHCCLNNLPRGFINAAEASVMESDEGYYINLYSMTLTRFGDTLIRVGGGYFTSGKMSVSVRNPGDGKKLFLRKPTWSKKMSVRVGSETKSIDKFEEKNGYAVIPLSSDVVVWLIFDMTPRVNEFAGEWRDLPADDYHIRRWQDDDRGVCNSAQMLKAPMAHIYRGALLLARSKRIGATKEEMFSGETVFGKEYTCMAEGLQSDRKLTLCKVTLTYDGKDHEYLMCDYASAANSALEDPWYFTVFV